MRNKPYALFIFWFVAFSVIATSSEGQQASDYQNWRPRLLRTSNPPKVKPMARQRFRLESTPFGIEVQLYPNNQKRGIKGELLFVDEDSITILTRYEETKTYSLAELFMVRGKIGRIAPRTYLIQTVGVLSTAAVGAAAIYAAPANVLIAAAVNRSINKSLRITSWNPEEDWEWLQPYSRFPAGLPVSEAAP